LISVRTVAAVTALALCALCVSNDARALGIPAGTTIDNTASVSYSVGTVTATTTSNTVTVTVAEIVDVLVTVQTPEVPVAPGAAQEEIRYRVTNTGNGPETFHLVMNNAIAGDQFEPLAASPAIYLDSNGNGSRDAADAAYVAGTNDPVLNADAFVTVFVVNDIPASVTDGDIGRSSLSAEARTGSGAPGTVFAGKGAADTDAIIGLTGALALGTGEYHVQGVTIVASKSQSVADQFGGTSPVPGATINYTIAVSATGTGSATAVVFTDNIPAGTTYVPGTLTLNGAALTDGGDADAGAFDATAPAHVSVQLGTLTQASGAQTVQFAVRINN
jgi:uncharacterized repeat protein (TIGR01451 family)